MLKTSLNAILEAYNLPLSLIWVNQCSVFIPGYAILLSLALLDYVHVKFLEGVWTKWSILIFNLIWRNPSLKIQSGMWNYLKYLIWLILVGFAWITIDGRILAAYLIGEILNVSVFFVLSVLCLNSKEYQLSSNDISEIFFWPSEEQGK